MKSQMNLRIKAFLCVCVLLVMAIIPMTSCAKKELVEVDKNGIEYTLAGDKSFYTLSSVGSFKGDSLSVPSEINGIPVTAIGDNAFYNNQTIVSVELPDSITSIGYNAFYNCANLADVSFPEELSFIGTNALYNTALFFDDSIRENNALYIGKQLIDVKNSIEGHYEIKDGTTVIASGAFSGCKKLTEVTIPDSVTRIDSYAFYGCAALTSITLPESITEIGSYAFNGCKIVSELTIHKNIKKIGREAFGDCTALTRVTFEVTKGWQRHYKGVWASTVQKKNLSDRATAAKYLTLTFAGSDWSHK